MRSFVACFLLFFCVSTARADEVAPELERTDRRLFAQSELGHLVAQLSLADRKRIVGVYAAFDDDAADPIAQVACDDDGDYVVVLSDAMLALAANLARASLMDESDHGTRVSEYSVFLWQSQVAGKRLLPLPGTPGLHGEEKSIKSVPLTQAAYEARLRDVLAFIVARELAHLRAGDLVCPHPTATKEIGDDMWTAAERREAASVAKRVYPGDAEARDAEAIALIHATKHGDEGARALALFKRSMVGRPPFASYVRTHPLTRTHDDLLVHKKAS